MPLIENLDRLSKSTIWDIQKQYYMRQGIEAWNSGHIPSFMSSNAFVAATYAAIIEGFIRDCASTEPVTIYELGAGSGRLGYLLLRALFDLGLNAAKFRYVMTDFNQDTIDAWQNCEAFTPFLEANVLEFQRFDADQPQSLAPPTYNSAGTIIVANYVVDTLRQDAFRVEDEGLMECRIAVSRTHQDGDDDGNLIEQVELERNYTPVSYPYYDDPCLDNILKYYGENLRHSSFLMPVGFLRCLETFANLGNGRLLTLIGDKGRKTIEDLSGNTDAVPVLHDGCFSFSANFNALARYAQEHGGQALFSNDIDRGFILSALIFGGEGQNDEETGRAFHQAVDAMSPRDTYIMLGDITTGGQALSLEAMLALLRLSRYETRIFLNLRKPLMASIETASQPLRDALHQALTKIEAAHYPLGISRDVPYALATLYEHLGDYNTAAEHYTNSLKEWGKHASTLYRLARCHENLAQKQSSVELARQCLEINPKYEKARKLMERCTVS